MSSGTVGPEHLNELFQFSDWNAQGPTDVHGTELASIDEFIDLRAPETEDRRGLDYGHE
jgi:hypothetical protein